MAITLEHYLVVGALLLTIGLFGILLNRRNVIIILMSVELILLSVNVNLIAFSTELGDLTGQIFALLILTVAAAEAAIGLAILVVFFRNRGNIEIEDINSMKGRGSAVFDFAIEKAIVFLPLLAAILTGFADKRLGDRGAQILTSGVMVLSALLSASPSAGPRRA